ncbi:hypothetical protein J8C02_06170 [Chloracidobacterium sp. MS 40/45]|uniref:hypothetical protein n=1 Tax=Chloracidobacterium aggregatum TaxID=2851959 RepID=UPI001B8CC62A|nr:hypothetical protein [Chloracidobacterium aggregatum]QUV99024.1 hypothetical protein J8C02_06170 [Chloracidobacterium sp. MS 40/45]
MPILRSLTREYKRLLTGSHTCLDTMPEAALYWRPSLPHHDFSNRSSGESFIALAGGIEYVINGILSNYWDHPAEWTMRETLATPARLQHYLADIISLTSKFETILTDDDLPKVIYLPTPRQTTIGTLLVERLALAAQHYGQALATWRAFLAAPPPHHGEPPPAPPDNQHPKTGA